MVLEVAWFATPFNIDLDSVHDLINRQAGILLEEWHILFIEELLDARLRHL